MDVLWQLRGGSSRFRFTRRLGRGDKGTLNGDLRLVTAIV